MRTTGMIYVSRLMGRDVKNMAGEELGKVDELVIDAEASRIAYAVISFGGGFLKSGKYFAVPWDALELAKDESTVLLNADKSVVENAPAFDKNNWPRMADRHWGSGVHAFFGTKPYWETSGDRPQTQREDSEPEREREEVASFARRPQ